LDALLIVAAGFTAGAVNALVGSGSLITFSVLVALGYSPLAANVASTVGLVPGALSSAYGYRREYRRQGRRAARLVPAAALGGAVGAVLLLALPGAAFNRVVPLLILFAVTLVAIQPAASRRASRLPDRPPARPAWLGTGVFAVSIYGGYFGAGAGFMFIALLAALVPDDLRRLNALRMLLAAVLNGVAGAILALSGHVPPTAAGLIAVGAVAGGQIGAAMGSRIPSRWLRGLIIVFGTTVAIRLLAG
jgi:hypothetical protein